jgi:general secretion pathway protein J
VKRGARTSSFPRKRQSSGFAANDTGSLLAQGRRIATRSIGFTLVEALVALLILAIVAVLAYRGTSAMTRGEAQLSEESARWRALDAVFTRLEADVRQAIPRASRHGDRVEAAWSTLPADSSGNSALVFSRAGPEFTLEPGMAGQRIGYRLRNGTLEVLFWPQLDNVANAAAATYALVDGIAAFRVLSLTRDGRWSDRWPLRADDDLPRAVKVELRLADGTSVERWFVMR